MKQKVEQEKPKEEIIKEVILEDLNITEDLSKPVEEVKAKELVRTRDEVNRDELLKGWEPKTKLGREVKDGKIKSLHEILDSNQKILEPAIVDTLLHLKQDLLAIGQSKGKFGGGKRRAWRQTQRKKKEGNVPTFSTLAVVGDENGHVGIGWGRAAETLPARDKAIRKAKLNIIKIMRGDGSFDSIGGSNTSIPFKVEGRAGSVRVWLSPAPPGTGLVVGDEMKKIFKLAGIKDVYGRTFGMKRTTFNLAKATIDALKKTNLDLTKHDNTH